ncbi:MAG TPA: HD domain-containing phosphohydrolase [Planctomycetota bacterium]|nr:HD domain-containing phosphohydrolase [Planctomycetota bacterium]
MSEPKKKRTLSQALTAGVRKYGSSIVSTLAISIKTSQLYSFAHQNVTNALRELEEYLSSFLRIEGEAELSLVEGFLFINEVRVRADLSGAQTYTFAQQILRDRQIGKIIFLPGISSQELEKLVQLFTQPVRNEENPWEEFLAAFRKEGFRSIRAEKYEVRDETLDELAGDRRIVLISLYLRALHQTQQMIESVEKGRKINLNKLKRTVQALVDAIAEDEATLLALVNVKNRESYLANHSVNVMVLTMAVGSRLGLPRKSIGDLGIAALLHDIGKCRAPERLRTPRPQALDENDRRELEEHVYTGVEVLLQQRIVDAIVKSMNVSFLHHFRFDNTGYPRTHVVKGQNLFSRIVAICDFYDNHTTPGPDGSAATPPDAIMRRLLDASGTEFDPLVSKAFVNLLGLYPVGSIVSLDDGSVGTVVAPSRDSRHLDRPTVRLFTGPDGSAVDETVDLLERRDGAFTRSILKLFQQEEVQLELEEFLSVI